MEFEEGVRQIRRFLYNAVMSGNMSGDNAQAINANLRAVDYFVTVAWSRMVEGYDAESDDAMAAAKKTMAIVAEQLSQKGI